MLETAVQTEQQCRQKSKVAAAVHLAGERLRVMSLHVRKMHFHSTPLTGYALLISFISSSQGQISAFMQSYTKDLN